MVGYGDDKAIMCCDFFRLEGALTVASKNCSLSCLDDNQEIVYLINVAMEVYFVQGIEVIDEFCLFNLQSAMCFYLFCQKIFVLELTIQN